MGFSIGKGDLAPNLELQLFENGAIKDLSVGYTGFTLNVRRPNGTLITGLPLTVLDAVNGKLLYTWQAGDTDVVGGHEATVTATRAGGDPQTFPTDGTFARWTVTRNVP